jgi:hypothetical protein
MHASHEHAKVRSKIAKPENRIRVYTIASIFKHD